MSENVADGVTYLTVPGFNKRMFRCEAYAATITTEACSGRWDKAQGDPEAIIGQRCLKCEIGAAHAGKPFTYRHPMFGKDFCSRCHSGGFRLIGNRLCVSCYNRDREVRIGKNGKGTIPQKLKLTDLTIGVILDAGSPKARRVLYHDLAVDRDELETDVLRRTAGRVEFFEPGEGERLPRWRPPNIKKTAQEVAREKYHGARVAGRRAWAV